jgi:uncharacterized protein YjbI with pentapeptide repeats
MKSASREQNPNTEFEREIAQLYRDLGARVEHDTNIGGLQIDVFAEQHTPDGTLIRTAIECKNYSRPLGVNDAVEICRRLSSLRAGGSIDKGVIVARVGFTHDARHHCETQTVQCYTPADLKKRVADFTGYLEELIEHYNGLEVARKNLFIPLSAEAERGEGIPSITAYLHTWADCPGQVLTLLGEYGSGKTTTAWYVAQELAQEYLRTGSGRIPVLVELRNFAANFSLRSFLTDYLINQKDLNIRSLATFERLNREGRFLLIFDAFDEMGANPDYGLIVRNFGDILALAEDQAKVLITCRTSFFRDQAELDRLQAGTDLSGLLSKRSHKVIFLKGFTQEQIQDYLARCYGETWVELYAALGTHAQLGNLADRPILLNMMVTTITSAKRLDDLNVAQLYEQYTSIWMQRDDWRCRLSPSDRLEISKILAFESVRRVRTRIHHTELLAILPHHLKTEASLEMLEHYGREVRTCTFLRNDLQGFFSFVHRSFAEFLAAKFMLDRLTEGKYQVLAEVVSQETLQFLGDLIIARKEDYLPYVWDSLTANQIVSDDTLSKLRASAAYLLHRAGGDLAEADLSRAIFPDRAMLRFVNLQGAKLQAIHGTEVDFEGADLTGADMRGAVLQRCHFAHAHMIGAVLNGADLSDCDFSGTDLTRASFRGCRVEGTKLAPADLISAFKKDRTADIALLVQNIQAIPKIRSFLRSSIDEQEVPEGGAAISTVLSWRNGIDTDDLLRSAVRCNDESRRGVARMIADHTKKLSELEAQLASLGNRYRLDGSRYLESRRAEAIKRRLRDERRNLQLKAQLVEHHLIVLIQALREYATELQEVQVSVSKLAPRVREAHFVDCTGLSRSQFEWLRRNGACTQVSKTDIAEVADDTDADATEVPPE